MSLACILNKACFWTLLVLQDASNLDLQCFRFGLTLGIFYKLTAWNECINIIQGDPAWLANTTIDNFFGFSWLNLKGMSRL